MKSRSLLVLAVLALLMLVVPLSAAQDGTFGLSGDDFTLFSSQNFDGDSISSNLSLSLQISGTPDGDVSVDIGGSGILGKDDAGMPKGQVTLTGSMTQNGATQDINLEARAVNGTLYTIENGGEWTSSPLQDTIGSLEAMANPDTMTDNPDAMAAMGDLSSTLGDLQSGEFIQIARLDDMSGLAHFQTTFDIQAFLGSDSFNSLLSMAGAMSSDEQVSAMASTEGIGDMFAFMLQDTNFTLDEFIDPSNGRVGGMTLNLGLTIDPSMFGDPNAQPITIAFNLDVNSVEYDVPVNVVAPV